jgi:hypothetical protein
LCSHARVRSGRNPHVGHEQDAGHENTEEDKSSAEANKRCHWIGNGIIYTRNAFIGMVLYRRVSEM